MCVKSNRPYDYIDGVKIDVDNPDHQQVIIKRNKKLKNALDSSHYLPDLIRYETVHFNFDWKCPACGKVNEYQNEVNDLCDIDVNVSLVDYVGSLECCCGFSFKKTLEENYIGVKGSNNA